MSTYIVDCECGHSFPINPNKHRYRYKYCPKCRNVFSGVTHKRYSDNPWWDRAKELQREARDLVKRPGTGPSWGDPSMPSIAMIREMAAATFGAVLGMAKVIGGLKGGQNASEKTNDPEK